MVAAMQQYQALLLTNLKNQLQSTLQQHGDRELEMKAMEVFDQFEDPLAAVSTTYLQDTMIKKCLGYVEPEVVRVGLCGIKCRQKEKRSFNN